MAASKETGLDVNAEETEVRGRVLRSECRTKSENKD